MQAKPSVFKSTAWYGAGNLILRAVNFLLLPLYSQVLSTEEFGNYALILAFYSIALIIYQAGFGIGFTKFYLDETDSEKRKTVFSGILNTVFIISVLLSTIGIIFKNQISLLLLGSSAFAQLFFIVFISLFFENILFFLLYYFKILEKSKFVVFITAISSTVNFLLNIILVYFFAFGIEGILISLLVSNAAAVIILAPFVFKDYAATINSELIKRVFKFSLPLFIGSIFAVFIEVVDRYFIDYYLDTSEVGIYSFSYRIALVMNLFVISFRTAWAPRAINNYRGGNYSDDFGKIFTKLITSTLLVFIIVSLFVGDLFEIKISGFEIFNDSYRPGIEIIPVVLFSYIFSGLSGFYSVYPFVAGKSKHFLISDVSALIINVVLNILFIPAFGIIGAAAATLAGLSFNTIYLWLVSRNHIKINYETNKTTVIFISAVICFAAGFYINLFWMDILLVAVFILIIKNKMDISFNKLLTFIKSP